MKTNLAASLLAVLGGAAALLMPGNSQAANVGYKGCNWGTGVGDAAPSITQAGHTPVAVTTLDNASLAPLAGLVIENCNSASMATTLGPDVATAVANGMRLIVHDWNPGAATGAALPGAPAITLTYSGGADLNLATGSPIATGPGGTVTNTSLDGGGSSNHGYTASSLPGGSTLLLTTGNSSESVAFTYGHGSGLVLYGAIPIGCYLPNGNCVGSYAGVATGMQTYLTNAIAYAMNGAVSTTCASEGYIGTKLEWCKNICERGYTGGTLAMWVRRWTDRYRTLPYCAVN